MNIAELRKLINVIIDEELNIALKKKLEYFLNSLNDSDTNDET